MSKTPPGETTPDEAVAVDLGDLAARLAVLEKTAVPIFVGLAVPYLAATIASLTGEQEVKPSFLLANGATVGRTKWPQLFNEYGTKYGVGDGTATFTLPNMMGRVLVPRNTSGGFAVAAGSTGGAETVALSTAELAAHAHTITGAPGHSLSVASGQANIGASSLSMPSAGLGGNSTNVSGGSLASSTHVHTDSGHTHSLSGSVNAGSLAAASAGSGTAHENKPPYLVIEGWLIYAGVQAL
jgi:microcystin-dependent protein